MRIETNAIVQNASNLIQLESFVILWTVFIINFIFYKFSLKEITTKRHQNLRHRYKSILWYLVISSSLAATYWLAADRAEIVFLVKTLHYVALFSLLLGAVSLIKVSQIILYHYLFFKNMSQGIPRLIVNVFTVILTIFVIMFLASEVFMIHVTAMLATSAIFSIVLGLALQDSLGNLFSGVSMQIGRPFRLGDWIEVNCDSRKWTGQVQEINWRATFLSSFSNEWIVIPNKTMAQSQIIVLTNSHRFLRHSQMFRLQFEVDIEKAKTLLQKTMSEISEILEDPAPKVLIADATESWIAVKIFYSLKDFSKKYQVADTIFATALGHFERNNIRMATTQISLDTNQIKSK